MLTKIGANWKKRLCKIARLHALSLGSFSTMPHLLRQSFQTAMCMACACPSYLPFVSRFVRSTERTRCVLFLIIQPLIMRSSMPPGCHVLRWVYHECLLGHQSGCVLDGFICHGWKPHPMENKYHTICCGKTCICLVPIGAGREWLVELAWILGGHPYKNLGSGKTVRLLLCLGCTAHPYNWTLCHLGQWLLCVEEGP